MCVTILEIGIGLTILLVGAVLPFYFFFQGIKDYPTVTKEINDTYYFKQTEYGMAWTEAGKHLEFYKKRSFWPDKEVGHIQFHWGIGDLDAEIGDLTGPYLRRLLIYENNKLVVDTMLNFDQRFEFNLPTGNYKSK